MDIQMALATRVIEEGDLRPLWDHGLEPSSFSNEDARLILEYAVAHHRETRTTPSREMVGHFLPGIDLVDTQDSTASLCLHVIEDLSAYAFRDLVLQAEDIYNELGPLQASGELSDRFRDIAARFGQSSTYVLGSKPDTELRELTTLDTLHPNIRICWTPFQEETGGLAPGEVMMLYARPKKMKTWSLIEQCIFSFFEGLRVLFFSAEMPAKQIMGRVYCYLARFPHREFRTKRLFLGKSQEAQENVFKVSQISNLFHENPNFIIHDADEEGGNHVHTLEALVERYEPHLLAIDTVAYLEPEGRTSKADRLGKILRWNKKLCGRKKIASIFTHHENREGAKNKLGSDPDGVYGTDQFLQGADFVVKQLLLEKFNLRLFDLNAARDARNIMWAAMADPCVNMEQVPMNSPLVQQAVEFLLDKQGDKKKKKGSRARNRPVSPPGPPPERPKALVKGVEL